MIYPNELFFPYYVETKVITIDDDPLFLDSLSIILENDGHLTSISQTYESTELLLRHNKKLKSIEDKLFNIKSEQTSNADLELQNVKVFETFAELGDINSVIVIDYDMPGQNGIEYLRNLGNRQVKKILLTGVADEYIAIEAFNKGEIDYFLRKQDSELNARLLKAINNLKISFISDTTTKFDHYQTDHFMMLNGDEGFMNFFNKLRRIHGIYLYYYVDDILGFLLFSHEKSIYRVSQDTFDNQKTILNNNQKEMLQKYSGEVLESFTFEETGTLYNLIKVSG